jgi:hypothetical protein
MKEFPDREDDKTDCYGPAEVDGDEALMLQGPLPQARQGMRKE